MKKQFGWAGHTQSGIIALLAVLLSGFLIAYSIHEVRQRQRQTAYEQFYAQLRATQTVQQSFAYGAIDQELSVVGVTEMTLISGAVSIDTTEVGTSMRQLIYCDASGNQYTLVFSVSVTDDQPPIITGVTDITRTEGDLLTLEALPVYATDPIDGSLSVVYEGSVDTSVPGTYPIRVWAQDRNQLITEERFTVTVIAKPVVINEPPGVRSVPQTQTESTTVLETQTITFEKTGVTIPYADKGIAEGSSFINQNTGYATTWEIVGARVHSNTDGVVTYFAGHHTQAFYSLTYLSTGDAITVHDATGHAQTYLVSRVNKISVYLAKSDDQGNKLYRASDEAYEEIYRFADRGEGILLQTCDPASSEDNRTFILVEAQPQ